MRTIFFAFVLLTLLSSCNRTYFYKPLETTNDRIKPSYQHGVGTLTYMGNHISLTAGLLSRQGSDVILQIAIRNDSDSTLFFLPDEVVGKGYNKVGKARDLRIMTARQVIKRRNRNTAIAVGVVAAAAIASVALADDTPSSPLDHHNHYFNDPFWFAASTPLWIAPPPGYIPQITASRDGLLRAHTLMPGEELRGEIRIKSPGEFTDQMRIGIPIDGQMQYFEYGARTRVF